MIVEFVESVDDSWMIVNLNPCEPTPTSGSSTAFGEAMRLLWEKEELQLQLDSHMRFVPGWDGGTAAFQCA